MKYLKKFETHSDYETYKNGQDYIQPNVSWCVDMDDVHYDMYIPVETRIFATFNNSTDGSGMQFFGFSTGGRDPIDTRNLFDIFEYDEGDGVYHTVENPSMNIAIDATSGKTSIITFGQGSINTYYTLKNETVLASKLFCNCTQMTSITLPSCITEIKSGAFTNCTGITSFTCMADTPPTISAGVLNDTGGTIWVPDDSVRLYQADTNWSSYAQRIRAISSRND